MYAWCPCLYGVKEAELYKVSTKKDALDLTGLAVTTVSRALVKFTRAKSLTF